MAQQNKLFPANDSSKPNKPLYLKYDKETKIQVFK